MVAVSRLRGPRYMRLWRRCHAMRIIRDGSARRPLALFAIGLAFHTPHDANYAVHTEAGYCFARRGRVLPRLASASPLSPRGLSCRQKEILAKLNGG